ncbi:hypothetical protein RFI_34288, partial [Reticulomyxa filosa]
NIPVHTVSERLQHKGLQKILESYRDGKFLEAHQQIRVKNVQNKNLKKKKAPKQWDLLLNDPKFIKVVSTIRKTKHAGHPHPHPHPHPSVTASTPSSTPTPIPTPPLPPTNAIDSGRESESSHPLDWAVFKFESVRRGVKKITVECCGSGGIFTLAAHLKKMNELRYCMLNFQYGHIAKRKKLLLIIWIGGQKLEQSGLIAMFKHKKNIEDILG